MFSIEIRRRTPHKDPSAGTVRSKHVISIYLEDDSEPATNRDGQKIDRVQQKTNRVRQETDRKFTELNRKQTESDRKPTESGRTPTEINRPGR